jgi:hypothetical protein
MHHWNIKIHKQQPLLTPKAPSSILESYVPAYTVVSFYSSLQKSMTCTYYSHIYLTKWDSRNFGQHIKTSFISKDLARQNWNAVNSAYLLIMTQNLLQMCIHKNGTVHL